MTTSTLPDLIPYLVSLVISSGIAIYVWNHRHVNGGVYFAGFVVGQAVWVFGYILELGSRSLDAKLFWDNFQWIPSTFVPLSTLLFALNYVQSPLRYSRRLIYFILTLQIIFLVLVYTNPFHHIISSDARLIRNPPFNTLYYDFHIGFVFWFLVAYTLFAVSIGYLVKFLHDSKHFYRPQIVILIIGFLVPILGGIITLAEIITISGQRDISPFTFAMSNTLVAWGLYRFNLLDVVPVARETVFENMADGVIVIDQARRVVDLNRAAEALIEQPNARVIGQSVDVVFSRWSDLIEKYRSAPTVREQFAIGPIENQRHLEVNISPLHDDKQRFIGRLVVIRDITQQVTDQAEIRQRSLELESANQQLQTAW
ncbi:MAG: PAS domain-containing protein, partial [Anaerolineae bacterium]